MLEKFLILALLVKFRCDWRKYFTSSIFAAQTKRQNSAIVRYAAARNNIKLWTSQLCACREMEPVKSNLKSFVRFGSQVWVLLFLPESKSQLFTPPSFLCTPRRLTWAKYALSTLIQKKSIQFKGLSLEFQHFLQMRQEEPAGRLLRRSGQSEINVWLARGVLAADATSRVHHRWNCQLACCD